MKKKMLEQEIVDGFKTAIDERQIYPVYQPQINHSTGRMVGAEALMRWKHPKFGLQSPTNFIPVLEKHDLLYPADVLMFEEVCRFQRRRLDEGTPTIPISVNMSRYDIFRHEYVDEIEKIRKQYDIPVKLLRIGITESAAIGGMDLMIRTIEKLHSFGYVVLNLLRRRAHFGCDYRDVRELKLRQQVCFH